MNQLPQVSLMPLVLIVLNLRCLLDGCKIPCMTSAITPQLFVAKWKQTELRERAASQEHFIDLCRLLDHPTPAEADPMGRWYTFEAGASKATGGDGWADVWKRGCFAWEYKGKHANLDKAYGQLLNYSGSLENPPLLIVSDIERILIHTHFTNTVKKSYLLTLDDLLDPSKLDLLRKAFTQPDALRSPETTIQVTELAATQFARIAQILRRYGHEPQAVAHFLIRLPLLPIRRGCGPAAGQTFHASDYATQSRRNYFRDSVTPALCRHVNRRFLRCRRHRACGRWFVQ